MLRITSLLTIIFLLHIHAGYTQLNFKKDWENANPVNRESSLGLAEKIKIHEDYLKQAVSYKNLTKQFYGALYLFDDYLSDQNYVEVARYTLQAENIAKESGNKNWQGAVKLKTGWLAWVVYNDMKGAIKEFEIGVKLCLATKDSLCAGECLEKIGGMYSQLKDFDLSYHYFNLALPILKRFVNSELSATYNNISTLFGYQHRQTEARLYLDTAIYFARKENNIRREMNLLFNRGLSLTETGQYDEALDIYKKCMPTNKKNNWLDVLANNYFGMADAYEKKGNYQAAYDYVNKYYLLKDSLSGEDVKLKVARLAVKNESNQKELALEKSQFKLSIANRSLENRTWFIIFGLVVMAFVLLFWWIQNNKAKKDRLQGQENLSELTRILLEKNSLLSSLEEKVAELQANPKSAVPLSSTEIEEKSGNQAKKIFKKQTDNDIRHEAGDFEMNLYNQRLLTAEDWSAFKLYFDKAFPGYLPRLRNAYPSLTEAEERLFLFIKLNLTNREAAAILGISADSVKKTRSRLRKRLALEEKINMDEFIRLF